MARSYAAVKRPPAPTSSWPSPPAPMYAATVVRIGSPDEDALADHGLEPP